ncbi:PepSY domain-containing protein [Pleionea litopenaei]|uniref:PepSY domain-containing protein n=1 Tax=Pleionea litopenaei TaxID=3070815 RepID=A0AA51RUJ2_9GAMM|nr:PepSY domain-containing protein [Pleionea sp. HL-JVS1]WMS87966.1 PepSY domain-containing protein [Pleionea sp. HL-JVS1]
MVNKSILLSFLIFTGSFLWAAENKAACENISKAQAVSIAQSAIKGKALSASRSKRGDTVVYRVKVLLENGRVRTILVDGCKGQVIKVD